MASGANHSRLISLTYPNGRVLNYNYASGLEDTISRLTSLSDSSATLEAYSYLGLNTVVKRGHPQPGVDLTYVKQTGESTGDAGDQYTGLDRFGRVTNQRWLVTSSGTAIDWFAYGYDRDGNPLYRDNLVNSVFGELYHANGSSNGYDQLNQLTDFARGTLNSSKDSISGTASRSQSWTLDALGNWTTLTSDGSAQTSTFNKQNEITGISGLTTPAYDSNGNMTADQTGKTLVYDAWNRLVQVTSGTTVLVAYTFDALSRRVTENPGTLRSLYYSAQWQVLEEQSGGTTQAQYVWSPGYVDALVERDRGSERLYVQQDANWDVTTLLDSSGNVAERYDYDPYGKATVLAPNWSTRSSSSYAWSYLHQGGRFDSTIGLYERREREYSPVLGRWLQQDPLPIGPALLDLYNYESNNPGRNLDPLGACTVQVGFHPLGQLWNPNTNQVQTYYHAFILVKENKPGCNSPPYYFRGGPQFNWTPRGGGGLLWTEYGVFRPGTVDWNIRPIPAQTIRNDQTCCKCYIALLSYIMDWLLVQMYTYDPIINNSNAVIGQALQQLGTWAGWNLGGRPNPGVWAPGWFTNLRPAPNLIYPHFPECWSQCKIRPPDRPGQPLFYGHGGAP
jgi:RHS repeat-associated protein